MDQSGELLVYDQLDACPYLPNQTARLPLRWPRGGLRRAQLDARLARGDRRSGCFLYRPRCPQCGACEAIRVDVPRFAASRTQRRIDRRGRRLLDVVLASPTVDAERLRLFNLHREQRGLAGSRDRLDEAAYAAFLVETCCETLEIAYYRGRQLVAVAICDRGATALSAVYCYYDVAQAQLSPGVFSVLTQIRLCRQWRFSYLYLGYYVAACRPMSYKAQSSARTVGRRTMAAP